MKISVGFKTLIVLCAVTSAGCVTTPMSSSLAKPVPADRLLAYQANPATGHGTLVVTRDKGMYGSGCLYGFYIDGTLAARFDNAETAKFFVEPGELVLRTGRDPMAGLMCGKASGSPDTQRETTIRAGETKHFRILLNTQGTDIQRVDP